jgi:hypothetical protein
MGRLRDLEEPCRILYEIPKEITLKGVKFGYNNVINEVHFQSTFFTS